MWTLNKHIRILIELLYAQPFIFTTSVVININYHTNTTYVSIEILPTPKIYECDKGGCHKISIDPIPTSGINIDFPISIERN